VSIALDPNVHIQEAKAATCDIRPGRRPRGPALLEYMAEYRYRAGITETTGTASTGTATTGTATTGTEA
jgi:formate dehydrogenase major subunit